MPIPGGVAVGFVGCSPYGSFQLRSQLIFPPVLPQWLTLSRHVFSNLFLTGFACLSASIWPIGYTQCLSLLVIRSGCP